MPPANPSANRSRSTVNACNVLIAIADHSDITLAGLTREVGLSKTAVHRLVHTLIDLGFVRYNDDRSGFLLGYRMIALGRTAERSSSLREVAVGPMRALRDKVNETAHLAVLDGGTPVYIEKVESTQVLRHWTQLGVPLPLHCGAASKCLAAFAMSDAQIVKRLGTEELQRYTPNTITRVDDLRAELERVRLAGISHSDAENYDGVFGMSVPIFGPDDDSRAIAALSLAGPSTRFTPIAVEEWEADLRHTAKEIEEQL